MSVALLPPLALDLHGPGNSDATASSSLALASDLLGEVLGVMTKHEEEAAAARAEKLRRLQDERFEKEAMRRQKYEKNKRKSMIVSGSVPLAQAAAIPATTIVRKSIDRYPPLASSAPVKKTPVNRNSFIDRRTSAPPVDVRRASVDSRRPLVEIHRPSLDIRRPSLDLRRPSLDTRRISYFAPMHHSPSPRHVADVPAYHFPSPSPVHHMAPSFPPAANIHRSPHRASMSFPPPRYHMTVPEDEDEDDDVPLALLPAAHGRVQSFASLVPSPVAPQLQSIYGVPPTDSRRHSTVDFRRQSLVGTSYGHYPYAHAVPHMPPVPYPAEPLISFSPQEVTSSRVLREFAHNASSPSLPPRSPGGTTTRHRKTASVEEICVGTATAPAAPPTAAPSQTSTSSSEDAKVSAATRFLARATGKKSKRATMLF
ncbi:hypothetical protein HDU86_000018 [Geranomyces michiganensis]|nr:hypothetical protein HDU86_000018 [Geranomyces michiganensis]